MQDIVVNGKRLKPQQADLATLQGITFNYNDPPQIGYLVSTDPDTGREVVQVTVTVRVTNANNQEAAKKAAENIVSAVLVLVNALLSVPRSTSIPFVNGIGSTTAGALLDRLQTLQFVVNDTNYRDPSNPRFNNGYGSSDYTHGIDYLDFQQFDGRTGSYADPNYNGQGMLAIMLHELVHMSGFGDQNQQLEWHYFNMEYKSSDGPRDLVWTNSDYFHSNEVFAEQTALNIASAINLDISLYATNSPLDNDFFESAESIYNDHQ